MKEIFEKHKEKIVPYILCGVLLIAILSIFALVSGAVMEVFGFEYHFVRSIILFFIIATVLSYPFSLIAGAFPKALLLLNKISKMTAIFLYVFLDTFVTYWGLKITDYYMQSVSAGDISVLVVSIIFALLGMNDIDKEPNNRE